MSESNRVQAWAVVVFLAVLAAEAVSSYVADGELFGWHFVGSLLAPVVVVGFVLIFPEAFTRSRLRERQLEWRRNRAGQVIVAVLVGVALLSLAALLLNAYLNGFRLI